MAKKNLFYAFVHITTTLLLRILFHLEVKGRKNIPCKGGFILAANHSSYLDPPIVSASSPRQLYFLAKEGLFEIRGLSWLIRKLNVLPISRDKVSLDIMHKSIDILKRGDGLSVFPEGTRIAAEKIAQGKRGVGFLSYHAKVPVVPTLIEGSHIALPRGKRWISLAKVRVTFGEPIYPQELPLKDGEKEIYQTISDEVMDKIRQLKER